MYYVIINLNHLTTSMGVNQTGKPYFCGGTEYTGIGGTPNYSRDLLKARRYDNEEDAWHVLYDYWGMDYSQRNFIVAKIHDKGFHNVNVKRIGENNG